MKIYSVYILANKRNGTLYVGMTSNLVARVYQHKQRLVKGFTANYKVDKLVWYGSTNDVYEAITKERQMKKWKRAWKMKVIEHMNPDWEDLSEDDLE